MKSLVIGGMAICVALAPAAAVAQRGGGPGGQQMGGQSGPSATVAQVGAGTTNGSTTGVSGPNTGGGGGQPPLPQPSLCKAYTGTAQNYCLGTVLGRSAR